jgi:hypothetical protein
MVRNAKTATMDLKTVSSNWKTFNGKELSAFNLILKKFKIKPIAPIPGVITLK